MTEKPGPSFQKVRDQAIRALVSRGGLTPNQVSAIKLDQVHLAANTLVIEADPFAPSPGSTGRATSLKLDGEMQRELIAWLMIRPDGPNNYLFPGAGPAGLDVATINQVIAAIESPEAPTATKPGDASTPTSAEREKIVRPPPKPVVKKPPRRPAVKYPRSPHPPRKVPAKPSPWERSGSKESDKVPSSPPAPVVRGEEPQAVSLDEIKAMRKRLADAYDRWAPVTTSAEPVAGSTPKEEISPSQAVEVEPPEDLVEPKAAPEPAAPLLEEHEPEPAEATAPRSERTLVAGLVPPPSQEPRVAEPVGISVGGLSEKLKRLLESGKNKVTFSLSYRAMAVGSLTLVIVCCLGFVIVGGMMLRVGGPAALLAGATPSETTPPDTSTPSPSPTSTPTVTATPTTTPSAAHTPTVLSTLAEAPTPPPTVGPTPTPIVIVVTATPTPEPPPTATPVPTEMPVGGAPSEPTAPPTPAFKYPAPVLLEPADGEVVPGRYAFLKWEPVGPLADDEWYAVRLVYLQQGAPVYQGDRVKVSEWPVPERFYYQADGPALEYRWHVFVERDNPDGSTTQISPESKTFVFRWE